MQMDFNLPKLFLPNFLQYLLAKPFYPLRFLLYGTCKHMYQCSFYKLIIKVHMHMGVKISMHNRYSVANALYREYEIACELLTHAHWIPNEFDFNFWFSCYNTTWLVLSLLTTCRNGIFISCNLFIPYCIICTWMKLLLSFSACSVHGISGQETSKPLYIHK